MIKQYEAGGIDLTRVSQIEQSLVQQQDAQASSHGQVAQGLIEVYRALGGGWRNAAGPATQALPLPAAKPPQEEIPLPAPNPPRPIQQQ